MYCPYGERVKSYYERCCKEKNDSSNEVDMEFLIDALSITTIKKEYFSEVPALSKSIADVYHINQDIAGYELTYIQSCPFIAYL